MQIFFRIIMALSFLFLYSFSQAQVSGAPFMAYEKGPIQGKMIDCNFPQGDSNYHAIIQASDGNVYYAICTHHRSSHVNLFRYNPRTEKVDTVADIGKSLGEDGIKNIPQGKVHCDLFEDNRKLWFGTHVGIYERGGTKDHGPYPGGHFVSYDLSNGKIEDLGIGEAEEGLVCLSMDKQRKRLYALTWPSAIFIYYDIATKTKKSFGPSVVGHTYKDKVETGGVPRSLAIDSRDGNVYWFNLDNTINRYNYSLDAIETLKDKNLDRPILKVHERDIPEGNVEWRSIRWNPADQRFYGNTFWGEYLFSWDPHTDNIEVIDRIAPGGVRRSGELMRASLAFELSPDGRTLYYVNGAAPGFEGNKKTSADPVRLITYDIVQRRYTDHGPIQIQDGRWPDYCQGLEIGRDGNLYIVCNIAVTDWTNAKGKRIKELRYPDTPVDKLEGGYEVNLVVLKDPIKKK
jgi:hypothetical protein